MKRLFTLGVAAVFFASSPAARAQLIAYEGFNYPPAADFNGQAGGLGFAALSSWAVTNGTMRTQAPSLVPPVTIANAGNHLQAPTDGSISPTATRLLATTFGANGTDLWMSVVMRGLGSNASTSDGTVTLRNASGNGFSIATGTGTSANYSVKDAGTGLLTASSTSPNSAVALLVAHVQFQAGNDIVDLYVNPPPGGAAPGSSQAQLTTLDVGSGLDRLAITGFTFGATPIQFDEVRLGTSFAAVTPVPEPSAFLLAAAAGLGRIFARRRR